MASNADKKKLLNQLRISDEERVGDAVPRFNKRTVVSILTALAMIVIGALFFLRGKPVAVEVATAAPPVSGSGRAPILQATGYVTARRAATVSAQITGTLTEVLIEEGERVHAGQVLAKLDDTAQRASLDQAKAQFNAAEAQANQYEAQLEQAQRNLKRNEALRGEAISKQDFETMGTQVKMLSAQLAAQRRQVELTHAAARGAEVQLGYATIKAPFSGVVTAKAAQAGEIISPVSAGGGFTRTGVGTIVDMGSLEIEVDVNEAYIHRVQPNQPAQAVLDAYPDWNIPAHVIAIIPTADRNKATVKVRVAIDQKDPRILPDMGVRVSFLERQEANAGAHAAPRNGVLVPASALVERNGRSVVFTVNDERAHVRAVKMGQSFGDLRLVEGISAGAAVMRTPPPELEDGAHVAVQSK